MERAFKIVYFNTKKDAQLLEQIKGRNFSEWVRNQIREEIKEPDQTERLLTILRAEFKEIKKESANNSKIPIKIDVLDDLVF